MKELETHYPCGCYSYREDDKFYIKPCSPDCIVYQSVIRISKELGHPIKFEGMTSCFAVGCPFAHGDTGTCTDTSCIAHPSNMKEVEDESGSDEETHIRNS